MINKLITNYHKLMTAYNSTMYNSCLDTKLKESYYHKVKFHQDKIQGGMRNVFN